MALSVILCVLLLTYPRATHALKIDVWDARYLPPDIVPDRPTHVLVISADGQMTFSGAPVANLQQLRELVDVDQQALPVPMLRVEARPNTRYKDFISVLAVIKRANVYQYCIDFDPDRRLGELKCAPRPVRE